MSACPIVSTPATTCRDDWVPDTAEPQNCSYFLKNPQDPSIANFVLENPDNYVGCLAPSYTSCAGTLLAMSLGNIGDQAELMFEYQSAASKIGVSIVLALYFLIPLALFFVIVGLRHKLKHTYLSSLGESKDLYKKMKSGYTQDSNFEVEDFLPVYVSFHSLTYSVKMNASSKKAALEKGVKKVPGWDNKNILTDISGYFGPKTLTAIMGPSGCGKSTLLDVLADRKQGGNTDGLVLLNGRARTVLFKRVSAYVMQFDALFPYLTVTEMLTYSAELRIVGKDWKSKREAVKKVIKDLDLHRVAESYIGGDGIPGISGGQARRVTVGVELVTTPSILFLDEPTTGLDAFSSLLLVRTLKKLANANHTVIATIHQPRPDIFDLFDSLLLMKEGRICYFGAVADIRTYFESLNIEMPVDVNVADFVVDLTYSKEGDDKNSNVVSLLAEKFVESDSSAQMNSICNQILEKSLPGLPPPVASHYGECNMITGEPSAEVRKHAKFSQSVFWQTFILLRRSYKNISRDKVYFFNFAIQMSQFIFYGLLFLGLRTETASENAGSIYGVPSPGLTAVLIKRNFLFQVMNTVMIIEQVVIAVAYVEKRIFRREHASGAYSVVAYHLQFAIRFYVEAIVKGLIAAILCYFFPGLQMTAAAFFYFAVMLMVCSTLGSALGFFMVSLVPDAEGAANIHSQIFGLFGLYSGFFLFPKYIPKWMQWLYFLMPYKYSFEGLEINEFSNCMSTGESEQIFFLPSYTLDQWTNILIFMLYPPLFHAGALLGSFIHTRPKSFWTKHFPCLFKKNAVVIMESADDLKDISTKKTEMIAKSEGDAKNEVEMTAV